ncbi:MAG: hypothetical protein OXU26_17615 [Acidobacteriota bacterium]|nr:hypothetical protein [Acidobacteriota bacterium]
MRGSTGTLKEYTVGESLLDKLPEEATLISLPLKTREGDGSPVRAVALIDWFGPFPAAEKGTPE